MVGSSTGSKRARTTASNMPASGEVRSTSASGGTEPTRIHTSVDELDKEQGDKKVVRSISALFTQSCLNSRQKLRSSIYYFFEEIMDNHKLHHKKYQPGDRLFRLSHNQGTITRITTSMRGSINNLKNLLQREAPLMYTLFEILEQKRKMKVTPTSEELLVASGKKPVSALRYELQTKLAQMTTMTDPQTVSRSLYLRIHDLTLINR